MYMFIWTYIYIFLCVCVCVYVGIRAKETRSGGWSLELQICLWERCTRTSIPSTHAHVSLHVPMKEVQKLLAEAPRGLAGFPPYNGGGWRGWSFLSPPPPLPELRRGAGRPRAAEAPPAAWTRPAPGAAFPSPASASAPPERRDPAARRGGARPYRCRTGAARRCRRGCCSWRSRPPSCRCAPGVPSAVPAAARCLLAHTLRSGGGWGRGGLAACLTQLPWQPIHSAAAGAAAAPLRSAAEAGGRPAGRAGAGRPPSRHGAAREAGGRRGGWASCSRVLRPARPSLRAAAEGRTSRGVPLPRPGPAAPPVAMRPRRSTDTARPCGGTVAAHGPGVNPKYDRGHSGAGAPCMRGRGFAVHCAAGEPRGRSLSILPAARRSAALSEPPLLSSTEAIACLQLHLMPSTDFSRDSPGYRMELSR